MDAVKHILLLPFRLVIEYCKLMFARNMPKSNIFARAVHSPGSDFSLFGEDLVGHSLAGKGKVLNSYFTNGATNLLNCGLPKKYIYNPYEDEFTKMDSQLTDIGALSLTDFEVKENDALLSLEIEQAMAYHKDNVWNLSTDEAICLMSLYKVLGSGLVYPHVQYNILLKIYLINIILRPYTNNTATKIAMQSLARKTNHKLWKVLSCLNPY